MCSCFNVIGQLNCSHERFTSYFRPNNRKIEPNTLRQRSRRRNEWRSLSPCGEIIGTFYARDLHIIKMLWRRIAQPHIDYRSQLWNPQRVWDTEKMESLFRSFSNKIFSISDLNRWDRPSTHPGVFSGEEDGKISNHIYIWKILEVIALMVGRDSINKAASPVLSSPNKLWATAWCEH